MFKFLKNPYFLLTVIVLLGFLARLYKIDNPVADWHSWRQADTASVTRIYVNDGVNLLYPRYHDMSLLQTGKDNPQGYRFVEFPIFNAIHAALVSSFPFYSLEKWGRLLSVFSSLVSVVLIYILGKRFLGTAGGLLSALFLALLPFNIYFSRVILPEPMSVMFGLAALVAFPSHLFLSGLLFAAAILVKPQVAFFGVAMVWLALRKFGLEGMLKNKKLWLFLGIVLLPFLGWRAWIQQYPEGIPHIKWMFNADGLRFRPAFWRWLFGERMGRLILGEWGVVLFAVGFIAKSRARESYFPLAMFAGAFLYMSTLAAANVRHDYYQTFIIPAVALLLAKGAIELWNTRIFHRFASRFFVVGSILFMLGFSWYQVREFYKVNHPKIIRAGEAVARLTPEDARVVAPYNGDTALLYHTERSGWPYLTYSIEQLIDMGATYYVSVNPNDSEAQDVYRKFIILEETDEYFVAKLEPKPHEE